jgi:hypothetical protein
MTSRQRKAWVTYFGRMIVAIGPDQWAIRPRKSKYKEMHETYVIRRDGNGVFFCSCPGFTKGTTCKHVEALEKHLELGPPKGGYQELADDRLMYPQDWRRRAAADRIMERAVHEILRSAFKKVAPRKTGFGRPPLQIADAALLVCSRVYSSKSGADSQCDVQRMFEDGLLVTRNGRDPKAPCESKITKSFRDPQVTKTIRDALRETAKTVEERESIFAADGAEFNTPNRPEPDEAVSEDSAPPELRYPTIKAHVIVGTRTKICVGVEITPGKTHDSTQFWNLVEPIRGRFRIKAIAADKAYFSTEILRYCERHGIYAAIPPKINTGKGNDSILAAHARAWSERTEEEKNLYGLRQISEAFHSIVKRRMSENLRSRSRRAQVCELLAMTLVANAIRLVYLYVEDPSFEIGFLDARARSVLEPARESVLHLPVPSKEPKAPGRDLPEAA